MPRENLNIFCVHNKILDEFYRSKGETTSIYGLVTNKMESFGNPYIYWSRA